MSFTKATKLEKPNEPDPEPKAPLIQHIGNGLILRWANPADAQRIADCAGDAFRETEEEEVATLHVEAVHRLMRGNHPFSPEFAVIEDTRTSEFVACACLLSQEMDFAGVSFSVGRPDHVGTRFSYRGRGLAQNLMSALHERSSDKGHLLQIMSGIPFFFRQFGYEYALDFGASRKTFVISVPKASAYEPFTLKPASVADVPAILSIFDEHKEDTLFYTHPPKQYFEYQIDGWFHEKANPAVDHVRDVLLVVDAKGVAKGFVVVAAKRGTTLNVLQLGYRKDLNLPVFTKCLIRLLAQYGQDMPSHDPDVPLPPLQQIGWWINGHHPIYEAFGQGHIHETDQSISLQARIEDIPQFLKRIQSTLSKRLQESILFRNHSGLLKVGFFRHGFRMMFAHGHLTKVESWTPIHGVIEQPDASFPPETFLQLLFGRRSIAELRSIQQDVSARSENVEELLNTLFPKRSTYFAHFV